ncbi:hypothetical protein ABPG75_012264 [Micractinium tetrahymenae]
MVLQQLRVIVPAGVALFWALAKLRPPRAEPEPAPEEQDEGEEVDLELPAGGKGAGFTPPPPLKATLLDVTLPLSLAAVWLALFRGSSAMLADFHQQLGDLAVTISPWHRQKDGSPPRRLLKYTTPLTNRLGPRQALNTEVLEAASLSPSGFSLSAKCTSEGVPFASSFANHVQWVATPHGTHLCRLVITGECRFHSPVWGPLKGQIERESLKGMAKAYRTLVCMLERQYGGVETVQPAGGKAAGSSSSKGAAAAGTAGTVAVDADGSAAGQAGAAEQAAGAGEGLNISALLQSPQTNAAAFLAIIIVMLVVWRLAMTQQAMLLQVARNVASAVRQ